MRSIEIFENSLPMDTKSRMARAKELGFTIPAFHGTANKFNEFDLDKGVPRHMGGYAPHFASKRGESAGYAKERNGTKVLSVLLRLKNPLEISLDKTVSPDFYEKIVGNKWTDSSPPKSYWMIDDLRKKFGGFDADRKTQWTKIYHHLMSLGYDGFHYSNTPSDYMQGTYEKYIVFEPKNVRLTKAAFDPSKSDSANLMA